MNQKLKYVGLLAILPLFTMALTIGYVGDADAVNTSTTVGNGGDRFGETTKSKMPGTGLSTTEGNGGKRYGATMKYIVCGDRLCSESATDVEAKAVEPVALEKEDPFLKLLDVQSASANSENLYNAIVDVWAGEYNVENVKILVESDAQDVQTLAGSMNAGDHKITTVKINANDPSSISAQILSWNDNPGSQVGP